MARDAQGTEIEVGDSIVIAVAIASCAELRFARVEAVDGESISVVYECPRPNTRSNRRKDRVGEKFTRRWTTSNTSKVVVI